MLKTLQEDLNRRTAELDAIRRKKGSLAPDHEQELQQLASEQGQIADLTRNLTQSIGGEPSEPENEGGENRRQDQPQ